MCTGLEYGVTPRNGRIHYHSTVCAVVLVSQNDYLYCTLLYIRCHGYYLLNKYANKVVFYATVHFVYTVHFEEILYLFTYALYYQHTCLFSLTPYCKLYSTGLHRWVLSTLSGGAGHLGA